MVTEMIGVSELAEIVGCSERTVQRNAKEGKYICKEIKNDKNKIIFMFPVSSLPKEYREKYYIKKMQDIEFGSEKYNQLTANEREEMGFWIELLKQWQTMRTETTLSLEEADEAFCMMSKHKHPEYTISRRILYRKWKYYLSGEYESLIDNRGKHNKDKTKVTKEMSEAYLYYYMDEAKHSQQKCYEYMKMYIAQEYPQQYEDIPCLKTIHRDMIKNLSPKLKVLARYGKKAYDDICAYHIRRTYDNLESNDFWVGDTHTMDIMSRDEQGKIHRLYLNTWMDVRSGVIVGWHITANPSSQATIYSLRDAILRRNSIPRNVYVDNGREYLTNDVGGLGHRAKKKSKEEYKAPPIFARLGIKMVNALPRNARAKTIERRFKDFKEDISKLFSTYTGGSVAEKPEILKTRLKNGDIVIDEVLKAQLNEIIEYYFNYQTYGGAVEEDRGKVRMEVYHAHLNQVRVAPKEELEYMLLRSSKPKKVGQRGLSHKINGDTIDYNSMELHQLWGREVYYRYNPDDMSKIRVYDLEDRFLMEVPCADDTILEYGASQEEIKSAIKTTREYMKKDVLAVEAIKSMGFPSARSLVLAQAQKNKDNPVAPADPKLIELQRAVEIPLLVANGVPEINLDKMVKNVRARKECFNDSL